MIERTQKDRTTVREALSETAAEGPAEIKACVGATGGEEGQASALPPGEVERLKGELIAALKTVYDPEIPVDIYELGLIYRLEIDDDRNVDIDMTLTAPGCPVAGVGQVKVNLVFDPPWDMSRMSDEARLSLNMF